MSAVDPPTVRAEDAIRRVTEPCDFCTRPIVWTEARHARMPVDAEPDDGGNVLVQVGPGGLTAAVIGTEAQRAAYAAQGWRLRLAHKLTCPYADRWSQPSDRARQRNHAARGRR